MNEEIGEIIAKCWADAGFKQRLLADPNGVLKAEGIPVPDGVTVNILENSDRVIHYVLPRNPDAELSDAELAGVAGGKRAHGCFRRVVTIPEDKSQPPTSQVFDDPN